MESERFGPLDLLPEGDLAEKLISLALDGPPPAPAPIAQALCKLKKSLLATDTSQVRLVIFGGGTGLSNLIGGDSRNPLWPRNPFQGLKEIFPRTRSVVCVTDDGGSTGELLRDLPLIALGDLRHVLLSSVRRQKLQKQYGLDDPETDHVALCLHRLFNHRFAGRPQSVSDLLDGAGVSLDALPEFMARTLYWLLDELFTNVDLAGQLGRPHCLGNLLLAAAICQHRSEHGGNEHRGTADDNVLTGIRFLADLIGANADAVMPCTTTPAHLKILYENGVLVSGEEKTGKARRGVPMEQVFVEFAAQPKLPPDLLMAIDEADIILFAPGSLFTSIVPILQVPGIVDAVRKNTRALKALVANLWVQTGETDIAPGDSARRFQVSDLITGYHRNIPGGVVDLFQQILVLGLRDIPGSILQRYAIENKVPIYLDRERVKEMGFTPLEARLYSQGDIDERRVIQHDPASCAETLRAMWAIRRFLSESKKKFLPPSPCRYELLINGMGQTPRDRQAEIRARLRELAVAEALLPKVAEIFWRHWDIPAAHLDYVAGVRLLETSEWARGQEWDNLFSFYDPADRLIKIRRDVEHNELLFEVGFLVALGQSLLGNYAAEKVKLPVERDGDILGYEFRLSLRTPEDRRCFFSAEELHRYLGLVRMLRSATTDHAYTRLVNSDEGFTPPGLLFGLTYAWYLDNRFACNIEYKMSISRMAECNLIPEQKRINSRRREMIDFFRTVVFRYSAPQFQPRH